MVKCTCISMCLYTYICILKLSHYTPLSHLGERKYSSCSFSTSAIGGGVWSASRTGCSLAPGKGPPVPIVQEAGSGYRAGLDTEARGKVPCLCRGSNLDRPVFQPVARHYTDLVTLLTYMYVYIYIYIIYM
jgi:hypothetical protein